MLKQQMITFVNIELEEQCIVNLIYVNMTKYI